MILNGKKEIGNVKDDALLIFFLIFGFADTFKSCQEKQNMSKLLMASMLNRNSFYVHYTGLDERGDTTFQFPDV